MPRLKGTFNPRGQKEAFDTVVRVCMARKNIRTARALAPMLGMDERMMSHRLRGDTQWTLSDLWRLIHVLEPTPEEIVQMMSIATARKDGAA